MSPADFENIAQHCLAFQTRKAARVVTRLYDEALRPTDLKITQFTLMVAIKFGAPGSITELADLLGLERTTLTRNLSVLERQGLIDVQEGEQSRARVMSLTQDGLDKLAEAYPLWERAQKNMEQAIGKTGLSGAQDFLATLSSAA